MFPPMLKSAVVLSFAVALTASPAGADERDVPVADLVGGTPSQTAERLGLAPDSPWLATFMTQLDGRPVGLFKPDTRQPMGCDGWRELRAGDGYIDAFLFRDGRLAAVVRPKTYPRRSVPVSFRDFRKQTQAAKERPAGPLPLETGPAAYIAEAEARAFGPADSVRVGCRPRPNIPPPKPRKTGPADVLRAPLDLAFGAFTLVYWSPLIAVQAVDDANAKARAEANGPLVPQLRPGEPLPGGEAEFRARKGVRWHTDAAQPGYAVATLAFGGPRFEQFVALGVRDGRVEWIGPTSNAMGLCQSADGLPTSARKGCSVTGGYGPS